MGPRFSWRIVLSTLWLNVTLIPSSTGTEPKPSYVPFDMTEYNNEMSQMIGNGQECHLVKKTRSSGFEVTPDPPPVPEKKLVWIWIGVPMSIKFFCPIEDEQSCWPQPNSTQELKYHLMMLKKIRREIRMEDPGAGLTKEDETFIIHTPDLFSKELRKKMNNYNLKLASFNCNSGVCTCENRSVHCDWNNTEKICSKQVRPTNIINLDDLIKEQDAIREAALEEIKSQRPTTRAPISGVHVQYKPMSSFLLVIGILIFILVPHLSLAIDFLQARPTFWPDHRITNV